MRLLGLKGVLTFIVICFFSVTLYSQNKKCYIHLRGIAEEGYSPAREVKIRLLEGGNTVEEFTTDFDGRFEFTLDTGRYYTIIFLKEGYVSKKLAYKTNVPKDESMIWENDCAISMVKECGSVDVSALEKPIDEIKYDPRSRSFKSDKDYAKEMFKKLDDIYFQLSECHYQKYNDLLKQAERARKDGELSESKELFREASEMMPDEDYPRKQMYEVIEELQEANADKETFDDLKKEADQLFVQEKYDKALEAYEKAYELNSNNQELNSRLNQSRQKLHEQLLAKNNEKLAAQKEEQQKQQEFDKLLTLANDQFKNEDYIKAKENYTKAQILNPDDIYIKSRLGKLDKLIEKQVENEALAIQNEKEDKYRTLISEATTLQRANNLEQAKIKYQEALSVKPGDALAQQKIVEMNTAIGNQQQMELAARNKDIQYNQLLKEGEGLQRDGNMEMAKLKFQQALGLKPGDAMANSKLNAVNQIIEQQKQLQLANQQKEQLYKQTLARADGYMKNEQLELAKTEYGKLVALNPGDLNSKQKIKEIELLIQQQLAEKQKEQDQENAYQAAINRANQLILDGNFVMAKQNYQQALSIKPGDSFATSKILLADNSIKEEQQRELAKKQEEEKEEAYKKAIGDADRLLSEGNYTLAKQGYEKALALKSGDNYASSKLTVTNSAILKQEQDKLAEAKRQSSYSQYIATANSLMQSGKLAEAKLEYQKALNIKPSDPVTTTKLREVDLAIQREAQQQMAEQQKEQRFKDLVANADKQMSQNNYQEALTLYNQARALKPADVYTETKISEINQTMAKTREEEEKQQEYESALARANEYFNKSDMQNAKKYYSEAMNLKPGATYPKSQIEKIDKLLAMATQQAATSAQKPAETEKSKLTELSFKSDDEKNVYLNGLSKKYPNGITLEVYKEQYKTTYRYIIIRNGEVNEFRQVSHSWGGVDYSINGKATNDMYFRQQTSKRDGEYYKKFDM